MEYLSSSIRRRIQKEYPNLHTISFGPSSLSLQLQMSSASSSSFQKCNMIVQREFGNSSIDCVDFANQFSRERQLTNTNEKESLQRLNDRFARFIEKVHGLENHNKTLEKEIEDMRQRRPLSSSLSQLYDPEIKDLRKQVNELTQQKRHIEIELQHLEDNFYTLRGKYDQEVCTRKESEKGIMAVRRHINDAYLYKSELDKKAQSLVEEIVFLKKKHREEVTEMMAKIHEARFNVEIKCVGTTGITAALGNVRNQLEGQVGSDIQQNADCFYARMAGMLKAAESNKEALKATKLEIVEHRRQLQSKSIELDTVKSAKEALLKQLNNLEEGHEAEVNYYQDTIRRLVLELKHSQSEMSGHCREYQDLLNVKMALDVEIASYRRLLEGEEMRLESCTHGPVPYVYRQSPFYRLPYLTRPRSRFYRAEPQYKFVEEIITETTKEVELSETETESDKSNGEGLFDGRERASGDEGDDAEVTAEFEETVEEEDAPGWGEELEETWPEAVGQEGAVIGEEREKIKGAESERNAEEETKGKEPSVSYKDKRCETGDTEGRGQVRVGEGCEEKPQSDAKGAVTAEDRASKEKRAGEKSVEPQWRHGDGLSEVDAREESHHSAPSDDKPKEDRNDDDPGVRLQGRPLKEKIPAGKESHDTEKKPDKDSHSDIIFQEPQDRSPVKPKEAKISRTNEKEEKDTGICATPKDSLTTEPVDPVKSLGHSTPKMPKNEKDTPLTSVASKDLKKMDSGSLIKSEETDMTTPKPTLGEKTKSGTQESKVPSKEESASNTKDNEMGRMIAVEGGEKLSVTKTESDMGHKFEDAAAEEKRTAFKGSSKPLLKEEGVRGKENVSLEGPGGKDGREGSTKSKEGAGRYLQKKDSQKELTGPKPAHP